MERYVYDGEDIIKVYNEGSRVIASYLHGPGIDEPLQALTDEFWGFFVSDGLGSVKKLVNMAGVVRQTYEYDSFGRLLAVRDENGDLITPDMPGFIHQPFTFTGREMDWESDLYYYRARYYDPESGRFIGEDPLWGINPYDYVRNNPIILTDPFGLKSYIAVNAEGQVSIFTFVSLSGGVYFIIDPDTGDAYVYNYVAGGAGVGIPYGGAAGVEVGTYDTDKSPDDLSGGYAGVTGYAAAGPKGRSFSIVGWGGDSGATAGYAAGYGFGVAGQGGYMWYDGKIPFSELPDKVREYVEKEKDKGKEKDKKKKCNSNSN